MENYGALRDDLLRALRRDTHGAAAEAMAQRGLRYEINYGVSAVAIRREAARYAPDHPFARALYGEAVRELILAATCIADPLAVTTAELPLWSAGIRTSEVAEHLSSMLARSPLAAELATEMLAGEDPLAQYCALLTVAKYLTRGGDPLALRSGQFPARFEAADGSNPLVAGARELVAQRLEL